MALEEICAREGSPRTTSLREEVDTRDTARTIFHRMVSVTCTGCERTRHTPSSETTTRRGLEQTCMTRESFSSSIPSSPNAKAGS